MIVMDLPETTPLKIPTVLTCRVNDLDKPIVAALIQATGITDTSQLIRYAMRAAHRELAASGFKATSQTTHTAVDPRG
jgi:hypothetical protein